MFGEKKDAKDVAKLIKDEKVRFVRMCFTDILGRDKAVTATAKQFTKALTEGQSIDGSSVEGFARIEESDLIIMPDCDTFVTLPWRIDGEKIGLVFCDVITADDKPYPGDPRGALRRVIDEQLDENVTAYFGPEIEFFYFLTNGQPAQLDTAGYFDNTLGDLGTKARKRALIALEQMGIDIETLHHEVAGSQHEIDPQYGNALHIADIIQLTKMAIRETARELGIKASFMPKPLPGENGNGMHVHMSLYDIDKEENLFHDSDNEYGLSERARHYVAGLLHHAPAFCLVTNQWLNSYKRLVPGYEAPTYISCGRRNRSSLVRIPLSKSDRATRVELRNPDPACNPYLALAVMLAAGLDGVAHTMPFPTPVERDIFTMSDEEKEQLQINSLPHSLEGAINEFAASEFMRATLGDHIFEHLIKNKRIELLDAQTAVTDYEIKRYLDV